LLCMIVSRSHCRYAAWPPMETEWNDRFYLFP
jgi:hypothetical protein